MALVLFLGIFAVLGLIPAAIAHGKGRDFGSWYLYGFLLFGIALIHALVIRSPAERRRDAMLDNGVSEAEELERFFALKEKGVLSEEEYEAKKRELLRLPAKTEADLSRY